MVVKTDVITARLGTPRSTVERGTIEGAKYCYVRRWAWGCGCSGEIIAGTLIELASCTAHLPDRAA